MKARSAFLASIFLALVMTGCVVSIGGNGSHARDEVSKPPETIVVMPSGTEDAAVIAEIDAAGKLSYEEGRLNTLKNVAQRPTLSATAQVHLVNMALRLLSFDASRVDVLLTLISNPAFSPPAKEAILRQLNGLAFENSKRDVLNAIQQRTGSSS